MDKSKALGPKWPEPALFDLAVQMFYLRLCLYWSCAGRTVPHGVEWLADAMIANMASAVENAPPPPGPYASKTRRRLRA